MDWELARRRLQEPVPPYLVAVLALILLGALDGEHRWVHRQLDPLALEVTTSQRFVRAHTEALELARVRHELRDRDLNQFKNGFSDTAKSRKTLFEEGLSLQEERRLLDKQLEIMTTSLLLNPALQRIFIMKGSQPLQSFLISHIPPKGFGDVPETLPAITRIISKERFAHPERGKSEQINGQIQWIPPQVGTSVRSNALGEFVIFTNSKLILHGPPLNPEDHEKFPHICLGLDLEAAKKIYRSSFIGTKIILRTPVSAQ